MLSLFKGRPRQVTRSAPPGRRAYAIGDIHGRLDLLVQLVKRIEEDDASRGPAKTFLIFLGDYVDRGPDSKGVIEFLVNWRPRFHRVIHLAGNHEEAFLRVLNADTNVVPGWLIYGGKECAQSYGINGSWLLTASPEAVTSEVARHVPPSHFAFLESLADTFRFGDYLFVHAGVRGGVPIEEQDPKDLRWIREGFLDEQRDHGFMVVHGHTIVEQPEEHSNRIAIDTGAYKSGTLTAIGLEGTDRWFVEARA